MVSIETTNASKLQVEQAVASILRLLNPNNLENSLMGKKPSELIEEIKQHSSIVRSLLIETTEDENDGILNYKAQGKHLVNSRFIMSWGYLDSSVQSMEDFRDTMYHTDKSFFGLLEKFYNDIKDKSIWA
jgi:hypothetical protein